MDRIAQVGKDIWISAQAICDRDGEQFDRRLHIHSVGQVPPCRNVVAGDLQIVMTEKVCLGPELIRQIWDFAAKPGRLLIHCGAGMCRSPTAAVVALMARGSTIGQAMGQITDGTCLQYEFEPISPWWEHAVIQQIFWVTKNWVGVK